MAWSFAAWALVSSLLAVAPAESLSASCEPGNTVPPDCLVTLQPDLGPSSPYQFNGEVGTGSVLHWCVGVSERATADRFLLGGGIGLDPPQARVSASCRLF